MPENPLLNRELLEKAYSTYAPDGTPIELPNVPFKSPNLQLPTVAGEPTPSALSAIENSVLNVPLSDGKLKGGSISRTLKEVTSPRYNVYIPGDYNNEDAYGQGQGVGNKIVNAVGKGLLLTGTTFLQSTAGLINGVGQSINDGRLASFYDNDFNRKLDELNKAAEDALPNYYKDIEKNANWYSPKKLFTANFFWDGIIKNLGFAAGAAAAGGVYAGALKSIPLTSRLFSVGKAAETLAATEEALLTANKVADTYGKVKSLSDKFLGSYNLLNPGGRALVAGLATTGEAGFEAFHNLNEFRNEKIQEWKDTHGGMTPIGSDLEAINMEADAVGNSSFVLNTALLSATNYIQFPKILGSSYTAEKGMINSLTKEIGDITQDATGQFVRTAPTTRFGKILSTVNKIRPYTFSSSEGFEEGAQFAISVGTKDYYDKRYKGEDVSFIDSLVEGAAKTVGTNEGMENVLIGGLSGTLMMARGRYKQAKEKGLNTTQALVAFNKHKLSDFTKETLDSVNRGTAIQKDREKALKEGEILESKDLETDYIINYLTPRVKYGRFDLVKADIEDLKKLASTEEGFAQLQVDGKALPTDTRAQFIKRLASFERTAEDVKSLYQSLNLRYGGMVDKTTGKPIYSEDVINKMIYAASKVADYDRRIQDVSSSLLLSGVDSSLIVDDIIAGSSDSYNQAIEAINALKINSDKKEDLIKELQDIAELSLRRQKFLAEYDEIKKAPAKFKEEETLPPVKKEGEPVPTIKIKTKDGEEDVEVGTEYYLGKVVEYDKSGKEVIRFPKLTILGENEDGTIRIKDGDGERNVSKSVLESYKLGKVSDTLSNKKAKFFMENANTIFEFNFGKGKKQRGRLEYSPKDGILNFVYKDKSGKIREIEVTGDQFVPREGYSNPMISAVGKLTPAQQKSLEDAARELDERTSKKRQVRLNILSELFDELTSKQESTKKLISQKQQQVKDIIEELSDLQESIKNAEFDSRSKKALRFKSQTKKALAAAMQLSRTKDQLEKEIEDLETQAQELEFNASYVADLAQNIDELPTDSREFLDELKDQKSLLEDLILETGKNINTISKLIDNVSSALEAAVNIVLDNIKRFEKKYPEVPRVIDQKWIDFLAANPKLPETFNKEEYKEALKQIDDLVAQVEDLDITPNERTLGELKAELNNLQKQLSETEKEIKAKDAILSKFEQIAELYKIQQEEQAKIANNKALLQKFLGTHSKEQEVNISEGGFQPEKKKSDNAVINGTVAVDDGKPHQKRANTFGINLPNLKNRDKLRAIEITNKTQDKAGIPGLIQHLVSGTNINPDTVVAVVFIHDDGDGRFSFINENGEIVKENLLESAIYQVRPTEKLTMNYVMEEGKTDMQTMFRDSTKPEVEEELRKRYAAHREFVLNSTDLQPMKEFTASFGILEIEQKSDKDGKLVPDYGAKNTVVDTGLVTEDDLSEKQLLEVATLNDPTPENGVSFKNAIGRVLLRIPGVGLLKMNTSKIGRKRAEAIFAVLHKIAQNVNKDTEKGVQNSDVLFSWLKSVVYWGIPKDLKTNTKKDASYNSVWFDTLEDGSTRLFISGKGGNFIFTPGNLELYKGEITLLLENLYHNVSNSHLSGNKKYTEITGVKDGEIQSKSWENYQTYLLSKEGRSKKEIPVTTPVLAIKGTPKQNRKGIYFVLEDNIESEVAKKKAPEKENQESTEGGYVFDGETLNVYTSQKGAKITFTATPDGKVTIKPSEDFTTTARKILGLLKKSYPDKPEEELKTLVLLEIEKKIKATFPSKKEAPKKVLKSIFGKKEQKSLEIQFKDINFVPDAELLTHKNPRKNKKIQDDIKKQMEELNALLKCLTKI